MHRRGRQQGNPTYSGWTKWSEWWRWWKGCHQERRGEKEDRGIWRARTPCVMNCVDSASASVVRGCCSSCVCASVCIFVGWLGVLCLFFQYHRCFRGTLGENLKLKFFVGGCLVFDPRKHMLSEFSSWMCCFFYLGTIKSGFISGSKSLLFLFELYSRFLTSTCQNLL